MMHVSVSVIFLLGCFAQARAWKVEGGVKVPKGTKHAGIPVYIEGKSPTPSTWKFPQVNREPPSDWKVLTTKRGKLPVTRGERPGQGGVVKIQNVENYQALAADLEANLKYAKARAYKSASVMKVKGVKIQEVKDFLKQSGKVEESDDFKAYSALMATKEEEKKAFAEAMAAKKAAAAAAAEETPAEEAPAEEAPPAEETADEAKEAAPELLAQSSSDVVSISVAMLIGFFVGGGVTFAVFGGRHEVLSTKEPLLAVA